MSPRELLDAAMEQGLLSDKSVGKTPLRTLNSKLSAHMRRYPETSVFVRTAPGKIDLRGLINASAYDPPRRLPSAPVEKVLAFPSEWLDKAGRFQGVNHSWSGLTERLFHTAPCTYLDRLDAENRDDYKQILTYVMVKHLGRLLAFKRGRYNRVEDFLRGSRCIGFGGHVASTDRNVLDGVHLGLFRCAARELSEELKLPKFDESRLESLDGLRIVGLLNDDSSPTGRRHFAFIMEYELSDTLEFDRIRPRELSVTQLRWVDPHATNFSLWDFEYWSQLCLREYYANEMSIRPMYRVRRRTPLRPPHILCVLGAVASGKSEATRVLCHEFGYTEVNSGRLLAELLHIPPVTEATRAAFQQQAWEFINRPEGPTALAQAIWTKAQSIQSGRILVDGIRQRATLDELRRLAGSRRLGFIFVQTSPDVAYSFYSGRLGTNLSIHDFLRIREAPVEADVAGLISVCDAILYNWSGRPLYKEAIRELMRDVAS